MYLRVSIKEQTEGRKSTPRIISDKEEKFEDLFCKICPIVDLVHSRHEIKIDVPFAEDTTKKTDLSIECSFLQLE